MRERLTVSEIADRLDVEKEDARGFIHFLIARGLADCMGDRKPVGRGKPEKVYSFVTGFEKLLVANLKRAGLF